MERPLAVTRCFLALALLALCGCPSTHVSRTEEAGRFKSTLSARLSELKLDPAVPLSLDLCVEIAIRNNLDYRVRQLRLSLQDEQVRLALASGLPRGSVSYAESYRNNANLMAFGSSTVKAEDQTLRLFDFKAVIPVVDWGATYFAYQIAKDRRRQEYLTVERARQTLIRDVRVAYARLAGLIRQERMVRVGLIAAKELLKVAQSEEREGLACRADTAVVESGLAQAAEKWSLYRRQIEQAQLVLAQSMSLPAGLRFAIDQTPVTLPELPAAAAIQRLEDSALSLRPELAAQDRERQIAANNVREQFARMLPQLNATTSFDWTSSSMVGNPAYMLFGAQVTDALLDGGSQLWNYRLANKTVTVEAERTLLLSLGILYQVDLNVLQLYTFHESIAARTAVVTAQQTALRSVVSKYLEGLETGTDAVAALSTMYSARVQLDEAQTDYQVTLYELEAASLTNLISEAPGAKPAAAALPAFQPAASLDSLQKILDSAPAIDLSQYPELEGLLKASQGRKQP